MCVWQICVDGVVVFGFCIGSVCVGAKGMTLVLRIACLVVREPCLVLRGRLMWDERMLGVAGFVWGRLGCRL